MNNKNTTALKNYLLSFLIGFALTICIMLIPKSEGNKPLAFIGLLLNSLLPALLTFYFMSPSFARAHSLGKHMRLGLKASFITAFLTLSLLVIELQLNELYTHGISSLSKIPHLPLFLFYIVGLPIASPGAISSGLILGFLNHKSNNKTLLS